MSGGTKATIIPFLPAIQCLYRPGAVSHPQLAVDGSGGAAPDPGTKDERIGFLGDQQLQLGCHSLGCLTRTLNDVFTWPHPLPAAKEKL